MSLREKVARSLCAGRVEYAGPKDSSTIADRIENEWKNWQDDADAAIAAVMEALEEPSEGMTWEGAEISSYAVEQQRARPISRFGEYGAYSIWQTMLRQFKVEQGIG